ncbi:MAG: hypothetical protein Q8R21_04730 [Burkholderiales bacterium]|nr:hypothetical protein [Burkholderiales bacterium]
MGRARDNITGDLFEVPIAPAPVGGSMQCAEEVCAVLSEAITKSGLSRFAIAARMSELLGREITKAQIDAWTAESKNEWRFPFEYAAAFEVACDCINLQELLARKRGTRILVGEEALLAEMGRIDREVRELRERKLQLRDRIKMGKRK